MEAVVFFIAAGVTLAGACGVVLLKNPVHAALSPVSYTHLTLPTKA